MELMNLALLALIQGITEFLPVSSSGHLILFPAVTGNADQGQLLDVAVHLGTLGAVMLYVRSELGLALNGVRGLLRRDPNAEGRNLAILLIIGTLPVILFGLFLKLTGLDDALRSVAVIGWAMLIFGFVLWITDQYGNSTKGIPDCGIHHALYLGLWQAIALIPGTSRSGIVISGARALGYRREDAAKLSMLMSIPTIMAASTLVGLDAIANPGTASFRDASIAAILAFFAALLSLIVMMKALKHISFTPYVIYRILLGITLLIWAYS